MLSRQGLVGESTGIFVYLLSVEDCNVIEYEFDFQLKVLNLNKPIVFKGGSLWRLVCLCVTVFFRFT